MNPYFENTKNTSLKSILINSTITAFILAVTILSTVFLDMHSIKTENLIIVYVLAVLVISRITPTYVYGILAAFISSFTYDFFISGPNFQPTIQYPMTLLTMVVVTLLTSAITAKMKAQAELACVRENRTLILYQMNQRLLAAKDISSIVEMTNDYLVKNLRHSVIFYTRDPLGDGESAYTEASYGDKTTEIFHTESEIKRVHRLFKYGTLIKEKSFGEIDDENSLIYYEPLITNEKVLGVIGIACNKQKFWPGSIAFLQMLSGQVTLALELISLSDEQSEIVLESEKEKVRGTLLRAISHDLRTPLTSILGAGSTILEQKDMPPEELRTIAKNICEDTQWLIRMVENILVITKISGDNVKMVKTPEAAEEVLAQSVSIVRKRFPDYFIHVHTPGELLIAPMDATLISQVIINLLENAIKNSEVDSLIFINLEKKGKFAHFEVNDNGKGIPEHLLSNLFETHSPETDHSIDVMRGMGIGLSICKTIIHAHGGVIEGHNKKNGGASFSFRLPLQEQPENVGEENTNTESGESSENSSADNPNSDSTDISPNSSKQETTGENLSENSAGFDVPEVNANGQ